MLLMSGFPPPPAAAAAALAGLGGAAGALASCEAKMLEDMVSGGK